MSAAKLYRILARGPKHFRNEAIQDGRTSGRAFYGSRFANNAQGIAVETVRTIMVGYAAEGTGPDFKSEIWLTDEEKAKLVHMKLVPVLSQDIIRTSETTGELKKSAAIEIQDDWEDLPDDQKLLLASQISGKNVTSKAVGERIISSYLAKLNKAKQDGN